MITHPMVIVGLVLCQRQQPERHLTHIRAVPNGRSGRQTDGLPSATLCADSIRVSRSGKGQPWWYGVVGAAYCAAGGDVDQPGFEALAEGDGHAGQQRVVVAANTLGLSVKTPYHHA